MTFEFRIPILPEPSFFSNVKLAALSLSKLGGNYATAPLKISIGDGADLAETKAVNAWAAEYPVEWRTASDEGLPRGASVLDRYAYPADADVVLLMDADACLIRPIDDLLSSLVVTKRPTVAGVTAHFPPFENWETSEARWRALLAEEGFPEASLEFSYSMASPDLAGHCPPYFNFGFVAFNAAAFEQVRSRASIRTRSLAARLEGRRELFFAAQIGLTLAVLDAGIDVIPLRPEYNCTNSDEMLGHGLVLSDIRVFHYLRTEVFDRHAFLCEPRAYEKFRSTVFDSPVVKLFQRHVLSIHDVFGNNFRVTADHNLD